MYAKAFYIKTILRGLMYIFNNSWSSATPKLSPDQGKNSYFSTGWKSVLWPLANTAAEDCFSLWDRDERLHALGPHQWEFFCFLFYHAVLFSSLMIQVCIICTKILKNVNSSWKRWSAFSFLFLNFLADCFSFILFCLSFHVLHNTNLDPFILASRFQVNRQ